MKQKLEIPELSVEEILKRYSHIRPIKKYSDTPMYLRRLLSYEVTDRAYNLFHFSDDFEKVVDYNQLSPLVDIKMFHTRVWVFNNLFRPSVGEVLSQIPDEYLNKAVAFEMLKGGIDYKGMYKKEFDAGFFVSVVRIYQAKNNVNNRAHPIDIYPTYEDTIPIGMTEKEFQKLFDLTD